MRILNSPVSVGTNKYITYDHVRLRVDFCEQVFGAAAGDSVLINLVYVLVISVH